MRLSKPRWGSDTGGRKIVTGRWESDRGEGVENCQNPLNALVEEIQQFKKISWGVKLFLNPILSIML